MKMRICFLICFILASVVVAVSQTKTVTNFDLEKYAQERVKAEKDLCENYKQLGFASPEEMARRYAADAKEREDLAARLRQERVERERVEAEREANARATAAYYRYSQSQQRETQYVEPSYFWSYGRRYRVPPQTIQYQQPGYYAGGQFWPTGSRTPQAPPVWIRPRH